jgi:ATP-dependent DNA helicase PIF1
LTGTGKSLLLREIIQHFGGSSSSRLAITASTGIAAVNIGGQTIHSWSGIGLGDMEAKKLAERIKFSPNKAPLNRWKQVKTLIIDESV